MSMQPREPTIWELSEQIKAMDSHTREGLAELKATLADLDRVYLRRDVYEARHQGLRNEVAAVAVRVTEVDNRHGEEIAELKSSSRWVARAALTGVIFPVVVAIIVAIALSGGFR